MPPDRYVVFFVLTSIGLLADLVSKSLVFQNHYDVRDPSVSHWWIENVFGIQTSFNGGALFGMFQGGSFWLAMLSLVALAGILVWLFVFKLATSQFLTVTLGLITGGILGNLYDRMGFGYDTTFPVEKTYHVRDWIHFRLEGVPFCDPWPNFNIADSLLVTGAVLLFIYAIVMPDDSGEASPPSQSATDSDS